MRKFFLATIAFAGLVTSAQARPVRIEEQFIKVDGQHFSVGGKSYYFIGANFWTAMNLGSTADGRNRLIRELDRLESLGAKNLRILGGSEGPDSEPWRISPAVQKAPGQYSEELLVGLDFTLSEMKKRGMRAVICLNNFWHWSGGMAQYLRWAGASAIPYPPPHPGGNWTVYQYYVSQFYNNEKAMGFAEQYMKMLITRVNRISGQPYYDDPTIMAWELANEPRAMLFKDAFNKWISRSAKFIKDLDKNHLVTTGVEGETPFGVFAGMNFVQNHSDPNIDYTTAHIWAENFGWYDPTKAGTTYQPALEKVKAYIADHIKKSAQLGKPLVIEEFGLARDNRSYDPYSPLSYRDKYFEVYFSEVTSAAMKKTALAGVNFWAWGGEAGPKMPYGSNWKAGDPLLGDPPHEPQGWYSVYASDSSTLKLIQKYTRNLRWIRWWFN
ncbi:MAG: cellulase family glycosylhydrolase [Bdellovibrionia bacterium]